MNMAQRLKNDNPEMFDQVMELKEKYRQMAKQPKYITDFERSTALLVEMFCKKQDTYVDYIVGGDVTGVYAIGDNFFSLGDIYYDLKENKSKGLIFEWQNHVIDWNLNNNSNCSINYSSYCMGARFGNQKQGK